MSTRTASERFEDLAGRIPQGQPLFMVNLLSFHPLALYAEGVAPKGATGQEAYFQGYIPAFDAVAARLGVTGVKPVWAGEAHGLAAGPADEHWDLIAIVQYPDFQTFIHIAQSEDYARLADPYRQAALSDWRLIASTPMALPG